MRKKVRKEMRWFNHIDTSRGQNITYFLIRRVVRILEKMNGNRN